MTRAELWAQFYAAVCSGPAVAAETNVDCAILADTMMLQFDQRFPYYQFTEQYKGFTSWSAGGSGGSPSTA